MKVSVDAPREDMPMPRRTDNSGVDEEGEEGHLVGGRVVH